MSSILFVYREYKDRRKRYGDELAKLGHAVTFCDIKKKKIPNEVNADILWLLNISFAGKHISLKKMNKLRKKGVKIVSYSPVPVGKTIDEIKIILEHFDYVFVPNMMFANIFKVDYMPLGFYKEDYYPLNIPKTVDVSFAGHPQTMLHVTSDMKVKWLRQVPEVSVYGKKICERLGVKIRQYSGHKFQRELYNKSKVNLDLPFINSPLYRDVLHLKNRFFEIPACKGLLVTHYSSEFAKLLKPDEEAIYYNSVAELKDIINDVDMVLIMTVNPGYGGQSFIENSYTKIRDLKEMIIKKNSNALIQIDGGVDLGNIKSLIDAGVDVFVVGSFIFRDNAPLQLIEKLKTI